MKEIHERKHINQCFVFLPLSLHRKCRNEQDSLRITRLLHQYYCMQVDKNAYIEHRLQYTKGKKRKEETVKIV